MSKTRSGRKVPQGWQKVRRLVFARDANACRQCGVVHPRPQVDHVIPVQLNGGDDLSNLQTLCPSCHRKKTSGERREKTKLRIGEKYNRWTIIDIGPYVGPTSLSFVCRCECGAERLVRGSNLFSGKSCGCAACAGKARRRVKPRVLCSKCGTVVSEHHVREPLCFTCAQVGVPRKYPTSISVIAKGCGITRQAVQIKISRVGFDEAMNYYHARYRFNLFAPS